MIGLIIVTSVYRNLRVAIVARRRPGFREFYKAWRRKETAYSLRVVGAVAVGAVAVAAAVAGGGESSTDRELREIKHRLDRM